MKKWTFLLAAGLLAGAAPVFTGCIDNDEPEGITILRGAKAELISAKKAMVEAETAEKLAQAELLRAEIKVKEAEAEIKKAQAELIKAQTEAEKAKIEAEIKKIEAEAEKILAEAEAAAQAAADAHAQALLELERLKATLFAEQQRALEIWINRYDRAQTEVEQATLEYNKANRAFLKAQNDSKIFTAADITKQNQLEANKRQAEREVENLKNITKAGLEKELKYYQEEVQPGELPTRLEKVQAEIGKLQAEDAQLQVKYLDILQNDENYAKLQETDKAIIAAFDETITIKEVKVEFPEMGIPGYQGEWTLFANDVTYNLNYDFIYESAVAGANAWILELEGLKLDENDKAWTEQSIIDLKNGLKNIQKTFETEKTKWQEAVNAYKTSDGSVNLEAFDTYAPLEAAVEAYNATLPAYETAYQELKVAEEAWVKAINMEAETQTLAEIRENAYKQAAKKLQDTRDQLTAEIDAKNDSYVKGLDIKMNEIRAKDIELKKAELAHFENPTEETQKAVDEARAAVAQAWEAYNKYQSDTLAELQELTLANIKKSEAAEKQYEIEMKQAEKDYNDKLIEYGYAQKDPALQEAIKAAKAVYDEKKATMLLAKEDVDDAFEALAEAYANFNEDINKYGWLYNEYAEIKLADIAKLTRKEAKDLVLTRSKVVWGNTIANNDADSQYDIPTEYLIGLEKEDVDAIIRSNIPGIPNWEIADQYTQAWFGLYGKLLGSEHEIAVAEATLKNGEALDKVIEEVKNNLNSIIAAHDAQVKKVEDLIDTYNELVLKVNEKIQDLLDRREEIRAELELNHAIAAALQDAIGLLPEVEQLTQNDIDEAIENLREELEKNEEDIAVAEGKLKVAVQAIEDFKNGKLTAVAEAEEAMNVAKDVLELAQERAKQAKEDLDKVIAALENAE